MMDKDREVYLVHYKRTAFSRSRPNAPEKDVFNSIRMDEALGQLIKNSVSETGVKAEEINDVITGCAIQADENWLYGGRHPVFMAGLPFSVPSMSLDRACSSSLNAMSIGAMEIMTGNSDIVLAGGMEHMTHVPLSNNPNVKPNIKLIVRPEYAKYDMTTSYNMGLTAEKLAKVKNIEREDMDRFSMESHKKAAKVTSALEEYNLEIRGETPAIISVAQEINEPRLPPVLQIMEIWEGTSEIEKLIIWRNLIKETQGGN